MRFNEINEEKLNGLTVMSLQKFVGADDEEPLSEAKKEKTPVKKEKSEKPSAKPKKIKPMRETIIVGQKTFNQFLADEKEDRFGIVVTGAGGDPADWVLGIGNELVKERIVPGKPVFKEAYMLIDNVAGSEGRADLVIYFSDSAQSLEIGKLAMWRLQHHGRIYWVDDFIRIHGHEYGNVMETDEDDDIQYESDNEDEDAE